MTHPRSTLTEPVLDVDAVDRLLGPDGERTPHSDLDPWVADVDAAALRALYRDMVLIRRIDTEGVRLQRQGELGLWAPCEGQEAAQLGTARALRSDDFVFPSYRETGVIFARGAEPADFVRTWRGEENSTYDPQQLRTATMQIIIGAQTLHAVGYAMGIQRDESDEVAVCYFGDGASSQGDVSEAMVFAASFGAPVVFVCQNNHWAISEPVGVQTRHSIAGRAPGFGIPSLRVDGNDVLGCLAAMRWATDHARRGSGPAFIEAVTYRMGPHTTADDPTRYRSADELELWARRDPLARVEAHLRTLGAWDAAFETEVEEQADQLGARLRQACLSLSSRAPLSLFDHVYAEPHSAIERERRAFAAYLDGFGDDAEAVSK